jgi:Protein of unknown function (DUF4446)
VPDLTSQQQTIAILAAGGVALLSLIVALISMARLRAVRRRYRSLRGQGNEGDLMETMHRWQRHLDDTNGRVGSLATVQEQQSADHRRAIQNVGMVRFDAFEEMGGRLSFSAAFLDDNGSGIVITSINGRTETRTYAKAIEEMTSEHNLSDEEQEAISRAQSKKGRDDRRTPISR